MGPYSTPSDSSFKEEAPDRTKWLWLGVGGIVIVMLLGLWVLGPSKPSRSTVWARHILIKCNTNNPVERQRALERIGELKARLEQGESFAALAKKYSEDEYSAPRGGDLGPSTKGRFSGDFEDYVWSGPIGKLGGPIRTIHGFHLVLIEERYLTDVDRYLREEKEKALDQPTSPEPAASAP